MRSMRLRNGGVSTAEGGKVEKRGRHTLQSESATVRLGHEDTCGGRNVSKRGGLCRRKERTGERATLVPLAENDEKDAANDGGDDGDEDREHALARAVGDLADGDGGLREARCQLKLRFLEIEGGGGCQAETTTYQSSNSTAGNLQEEGLPRGVAERLDLRKKNGKNGLTTPGRAGTTLRRTRMLEKLASPPFGTQESAVMRRRILEERKGRKRSEKRLRAENSSRDNAKGPAEGLPSARRVSDGVEVEGEERGTTYQVLGSVNASTA